ncbi:hypothetical protein FQR65_LT18277 [Abscondita terminalis]|nr:hypothetical protein FQR65_LT18277 [Abscondita terminalis]
MTNNTSVLANGFQIDQSGYIQAPLIGSYRAAGKSLAEINTEMRRLFARYLKTPDVIVRVISYEGRRYFVNGQVLRSGQYTLNDQPISIYTALGQAGGIDTKTGDTTNIQLIRNGQTYNLNTIQLEKQGLSLHQLLIQPNDTIFAITLRDQGMTLSDVLGESGGINPNSASSARIYVMRTNTSNQTSSIYQLNLSSFGNFALANQFAMQKNDIVYIDATGLTRWQRDNNEIQKIFTGGSCCNICRSPMAEFFLKQSHPNLNIESAGLSAMVGHSADDKAIACMDALSIDMRSHIARQINAELIKKADLILVMSKNQSQHIEQKWPFAKGKVFRLGHWQGQNVPDPYQHDQAFFDETSMKMIQANYSVAEKGKMTGVIGLNYNGNDQQHITQVLNHILDVYHQQNIERKTLESKQTLSFLDQQLPELKQQLEASEIKFNKFREQYNTVDVTQESELMLKQNVELEKMRIELKQKQAEYSAKYTPDHPLMAEINAQLAAIQKKSTELNQAIKRLPETQRLLYNCYP